MENGNESQKDIAPKIDDANVKILVWLLEMTGTGTGTDFEKTGPVATHFQPQKNMQELSTIQKLEIPPEFK